jgi:hypothetical protein
MGLPDLQRKARHPHSDLKTIQQIVSFGTHPRGKRRWPARGVESGRREI